MYIKRLINSRTLYQTLHFLPIIPLCLFFNIFAGQAQALIEAVQTNNAQAAQQILSQQKLAVNTITNQQGKKPLYIALENKNEEIATILVNHGADVNQSQYLFTLLTIAIRKKDKEAFNILLKLGADLNKQDEMGYTPLTTAVEIKDNFFINTLLAKGADINRIMASGDTPLTFFIKENNKEAVKKLLELGADTNKTDNDGASPLNIATASEDNDMIRLLEEHGATATLSLIDVVREDNIAAAETLLENKPADADKADSFGNIPLHIALDKHNKEMAALLVRYGADINQVLRSGHTFLTDAITQNDKEKIKILLELHADVTKEDATKYKDSDVKKETSIPLLFAASSENKDIFNMLFDHNKAILKPFKKSCLLTFTTEDKKQAVQKDFVLSLFRKTIAIGSSYILKDGLVSYAPYTLPLFTMGKWTLFLHKDGNLGVIVPYPMEIEELEHEYGFKELKKIKAEDVESTLRNLDVKADVPEQKFLDNFNDIINTKNITYPTRYFISGHGFTGEIIADISLKSFGSLLDILEQQKAEFIYINSCYAAGSNLLAIQEHIHANIEKAIKHNLQTLLQAEHKAIESKFKAEEQKELIMPIISEQEFLLKLKSPRLDYFIVIQATTEAVTRGSVNALALFSGLEIFFESQAQKLAASKQRVKTAYGKHKKVTPLSEGKSITINDIIKSSRPKLDESLPSVRFPGTNTFFRSINLDDMKIITHFDLQKMRIKSITEITLLNMRKQSFEEALKKLEGQKGLANQAEQIIAQKKIANIKKHLQDIEKAKKIALEKKMPPEELKISIQSGTKYIQVFPCDLNDFTLAIEGPQVPIFISKIPGDGFHCIEKIIYHSSSQDEQDAIDSFIRNGFYFPSLAAKVNAKISWFIKEFSLVVEGNTVTLNKLAIHVHGNLWTEYVYSKDGNMYYTTHTRQDLRYEPDKENEKLGPEKFTEWLRKFAYDSRPTDQALFEASGGKENRNTAQQALIKFDQKLDNILTPIHPSSIDLSMDWN